jgi:hypothetical protein
MKVKLLKQIRRRFEIIHHPKGWIGFYGEHVNYNLYTLKDKKSGWYVSWRRVVQLGKKETQFTKNVFETEKECISFLKAEIIGILRSEGLRQRKDKAIQTSKKVWYIK